QLPTVSIEKWKELVDETTLEELENTVFPGYLMKCTWFEEKDHVNKRITVKHYAQVTVPNCDTYLFLVEVMFASELPSLYQLWVSFAKDEQAKKLSEAYPQAVLCQLTLNGQEGILY